jgi:hypothetical protein
LANFITLVCATVRSLVGILLRDQVDGILRTVHAEPDRAAERTEKVCRTVNTALGGVRPAILVLEILVDLELDHDAVNGDFGNALCEIRFELALVKILAGHDPNLGKLGNLARICRGWRIGLHQLAKQLEISHRVHSVDLLPHGCLHVDGRIDLARRRRIGFAVRAQRDELELVL